MRGKIFLDGEIFKVINEDVFSTEEVPEESVDLIVTSPPYNLDIKYNSHDDQISYEQYLEFSHKWLSRCYGWLKEDGRLCLNIPLDKNKGGQQSIGADLTTIAKKIGFNYHSTIIWNEGNISRRTAWGSWMSASAPYVIAPVELILVLYKKRWKKDEKKQSDITREEFMGWTNGLWTFPGQNKKGAGGHPAAFPVELPRRCIRLFSFVGDVVLDPFLGSGSTIIAAVNNNRKGIGIEIDNGYCNIARGRILNETDLENKTIIKENLQKWPKTLKRQINPTSS
ncbi:MAG: site-specific DNA-methyltransferase [Nanoarchaeota archaeon]|nr:site-specific DNA-methyltransferase [Nanoarchaeota archaeon]